MFPAAWVCYGMGLIKIPKYYENHELELYFEFHLMSNPGVMIWKVKTLDGSSQRNSGVSYEFESLAVAIFSSESQPTETFFVVFFDAFALNQAKAQFAL